MPTLQHCPHFFFKTDSSILKDIQTITSYLSHTYGAKCYVVGGAVRDYLLDEVCKDYDIECFGIGVEDFEKAMAHLGAQGVGKSFFVYKYHQLDISLPRTEQKITKGHQGFSVELAHEEKEASRRRDFTVNALMYDIDKKQIVDYWRGLEDVKHKVLRMVDGRAFIEDSLRVLRAMRFAARLGFKIEKETCRLCQNIDLDDLPKERLFMEFEKMFTAKRLYYGLYYLFSLGIYEKLFGDKEGLKKQAFIALSKKLQRAQPFFIENLRPYYFLFIARDYWGVDSVTILDLLAAPNRYYKHIITTPLPEKITAAFVARASLKAGIVEYVGNYDAKVRELAEKLDVWGKPFDSGVSASDLMAKGYKGEALGRELERLTQIKINALQEKEV
ncbi:MAG: tRNA nucleotidyltransferase/poly(A) polymerase family protein [Sulfurovum sp.]